MPADTTSTQQEAGYVRPDDTRPPEDPSTMHIVLREDLGAIPAGTRAYLVPDLDAALSDHEHGYHCFLLTEAAQMRRKGEDPRWVKLEGRGNLIWTLPKRMLRRLA